MNDEHYKERLERGKKFSEWLRRITASAAGFPAKASEIARTVGISPTRVRVYLKDCIDHEGLLSLPTEYTIDKIVEKYPNGNADEAKAIVGILPKEGLKDVFVPAPGSTKYRTSNGWTIFAPPGERFVRRRLGIIDAYLRGGNNDDLNGVDDAEEVQE